MPDETDIELQRLQNENIKLQIALQAAKIEAERPKYVFWGLIISAVVGPGILILQNYVNARYQSTAVATVKAATVAAAADVKAVAEANAAEVKQELNAVNRQQDEKLGALVVGMDANVKSWKAYDSKRPDDMDTASRAVEQANEALPAVLPPKP